MHGALRGRAGRLPTSSSGGGSIGAAAQLFSEAPELGQVGRAESLVHGERLPLGGQRARVQAELQAQLDALVDLGVAEVGVGDALELGAHEGGEFLGRREGRHCSVWCGCACAVVVPVQCRAVLLLAPVLCRGCACAVLWLCLWLCPCCAVAVPVLLSRLCCAVRGPGHAGRTSLKMVGPTRV